MTPPPIDINSIQNAHILVRVGFDIPNYEDLSRIQDAIPTIKLLLSHNNRLILITKWGKIKTDDDKAKFSTQQLIPALNQILQQNNIDIQAKYLNQFSGNVSDWSNTIENNKIILYENVHFMEDEKSEDTTKRMAVAKYYIEGVQYFVDECFISSHRQEATNTEIKELLPWAFGLGYQSEINHLEKLKNNPAQPFVVIMGGAKLETKLPLIEKMLPKADKILLGGLLCFTFMQASNELGLTNSDIYDSFVEKDFVEQAKLILTNYKDKIILPTDLIFEKVENQTFGRDIGEESISNFEQVLSTAKAVFWNGPMGFFESPKFKIGTLEIAKYLANLEECYVVLGGGDTNAALGEELLAKYDFVSMGGGATLEYLSK